MVLHRVMLPVATILLLSGPRAVHLHAQGRTAPPPPPVDIARFDRAEYSTAEKDYAGGTGEFLVQMWTYSFEAADAVYVVVQARVVITPPSGDDVEDFDFSIPNPGIGDACGLNEWEPDADDPGFTLAGEGGFPMGIGGGAEFGVGGEGQTVSRVVDGGPNGVTWEIDLGDLSDTAATTVRRVFFAMWRCPKDEDGERPYVRLPDIRQIDLRWEIDSAGGDENYDVVGGNITEDGDPNTERRTRLRRYPIPRSADNRSASRAVPPDSRVVLPQYAFSGGTIVGTVISEEGDPAANAPVHVSSTIGGVVTDVQTEPDGTFTAEVPEDLERGDPLKVAVTGIATALTLEVVNRTPGAVRKEPPQFVESGGQVTIGGNFPEVELEAPDFAPRTHPEVVVEPEPEVVAQPEPEVVAQPEPEAVAEPMAERTRRDRQVDPETLEGLSAQMREYLQRGFTSLPVGRAIAPDGAEAITSYEIPRDFLPGRTVTVLRDPEGNAESYPTETYRVVSATIDRDNLMSGDEAAFRYEFEFAPGPERDVWITVDTSGPIQYEESGTPIRTRVGTDGRASFTGEVQARRGSLVGTPFEIQATVTGGGEM